MNQSFCIATISLVRNKEEEILLQSSLAHLSALGAPVFVTDGGSPDSFLYFLRGLPNFTVVTAKAKGVYAQAKASLLEAAKADTPFVLYTEPDKEDFFKTGLPQLLQQTTVDDDTGIIMASRSTKGFASFPLFQQMTETTINNCCAELIGLEADYCYGPFLLHKGLIPQLNKVQEDIGWGWRPYVFYTTHCNGLRVEAYEDDFCCPASQRNDNAAERIYRMKQLEQNIRGLVLSANDAGIGSHK